MLPESGGWPRQYVDAPLPGSTLALAMDPSKAISQYVHDVWEIRDGLPPRMRVWLGGAGASLLDSLPADVRLVQALDDHLPERHRELLDLNKGALRKGAELAVEAKQAR